MRCAAERHVTLTCCRGYPNGTRSLTQSLAVCRRDRRTVWRTDPARVVSTGTPQTARWNSPTEPMGKRLGITWWWYERRCNIHAEKDAIFPKCELLISVETIRTCESNFHEPTFQIFSFKENLLNLFRLFVGMRRPVSVRGRCSSASHTLTLIEHGVPTVRPRTRLRTTGIPEICLKTPWKPMDMDRGSGNLRKLICSIYKLSYDYLESHWHYIVMYCWIRCRTEFFPFSKYG